MKRIFPDEDVNPTSYKGMKVGDVITTYNAGYFVLKSIQRRFCEQGYYDSYYKNKPDTDPNKLFPGDEYSPLFNYAKINLKTGKIGPTNGQCDSYYCSPGIANINKEINELCAQAKLLEDIQLNNHKNGNI